MVCVTVAVLQGTRVSSSDASERRSGSRGGNGNGNRNRTGTGTGTGREWEQDREREWERETETDSVRQMCQIERRTASDGRVGQERTTSDGRVGQGDRQYRTDLSDRETDSIGQTCQTRTDNVRWTCQTERWIGSDRCVGQRQAALDEHRRYVDTVETKETVETETRLIFQIEYKRLHEEKKKTKHGRQLSLYTQFS